MQEALDDLHSSDYDSDESDGYDSYDSHDSDEDDSALDFHHGTNHSISAAPSHLTTQGNYAASRSATNHGTSHGHLTFLDLPREIRTMIYSHIYPVATQKKPKQSKKSPQKAQAPVAKQQVTITSSHWLHGYTHPRSRFLAACHINRQIRSEILPLLYSRYALQIHERSCLLPKTMDLIHNRVFGPAYLNLLQNIEVRIKDISGRYFPSPLAWLQTTDTGSNEVKATSGTGVLPAHLKVKIVLHHGAIEGMWREAYELGRECRSAGMAWEGVTRCIKRMEKAVEMTGWFDGSEGTQTDFEDEGDLERYVGGSGY